MSSRQFRWTILLLGCFAFLNASAFAQKKEDKAVNRVTGYVHTIDSGRVGVLTLWMSNVNPVIGITVSMKFAPSDSIMHLDSLFFDRGVASSFIGPGPAYRPGNQTLLINLRRHPDSTKAKTGAIPVGQGPLANLYFSGKDRFPTEDFVAAAVQQPPDARLMFITDTFNPVLPEFVLVKGMPPSAQSNTQSEKGTSP